MKLNTWACALACGLIRGFGVLVLTWWIIAFDGSMGELTCLGRVYRGYNISWSGSFIGLAWALPDGITGGALFAWLYNAIVGARSGAKGE